jgi:hypothetical protein
VLVRHMLVTSVSETHVGRANSISFSVCKKTVGYFSCQVERLVQIRRISNSFCKL